MFSRYFRLKKKFKNIFFKKKYRVPSFPTTLYHKKLLASK